jgi:hypothetical protein
VAQNLEVRYSLFPVHLTKIESLELRLKDERAFNQRMGGASVATAAEAGGVKRKDPPPDARTTKAKRAKLDLSSRPATRQFPQDSSASLIAEIQKKTGEERRKSQRKINRLTKQLEHWKQKTKELARNLAMQEKPKKAPPPSAKKQTATFGLPVPVLPAPLPPPQYRPTWLPPLPAAVLPPPPPPAAAVVPSPKPAAKKPKAGMSTEESAAAASRKMSPEELAAAKGKEVTWEGRYEELVHFFKGYGNSRVSLRQPGLGRSVAFNLINVNESVVPYCTDNILASLL